MNTAVGKNSYGKSDVSFLLVNDSRAGSEVRDISAEVRFEGEFDSVFSRGDNSALLPTRSMVNTVYALAQQNMPDEIETFAVILAERFLLACPAAMVVQIKLTETPWTRLAGKNGPSPHCFAAAGSERYTATVHAVRGLEPSITSGLTGLRLLVASCSALTGYLRDVNTNMPDETLPRSIIYCFSIDWTHRDPPEIYHDSRKIVRTSLLESFCDHTSSSGQHTMFVIASAALGACPALTQLRIICDTPSLEVVDLLPSRQNESRRLHAYSMSPYSKLKVTLSAE
ncbi:hypothetical protein ACFWIB_41365 [Streptomyces sp. NPDC127051]|uniref:hypothetical protein n=1 Tax=Streptomyces sp. NPDC127051 TaxID=3347119 RepID=UPI0036691DA1